MKCFRIATILTGLALTALVGTAAAADPASAPPQPFNPADFAYLDKGRKIPWAAQKTVDGFVAYLKSLPVEGQHDYKIPQVPKDRFKDGLLTYDGDLPANNFYPDVIAAHAETFADFKHQLDGLGIGLLFLPVPDGSMVYPDFYWEGIPLDADGLPPQVTLGNQRLFAGLDKLGVPFVNLAPAMILARKYSQRGQCRQFSKADEKIDNTHWSSYGVAVSAHETAKAIVTLPWYREAAKLDGLSAQWAVEKEFTYGDDPKRWQWERRISGTPGNLEDAPIVVVGDSNMEEKRGFAQQLMFELKVPVEIIGGMGGSANLIVRKARQNPEWLLKKKLVIWSVCNRALAGKGGMPGYPERYAIFPDGVATAKQKAKALEGNPVAFEANVTLEALSTAKTPAQWQPYTDALIYGRFRVEEVLSNSAAYPYKEKILMACGWGLVDGKQTWLTQLKPGPRRLRIVVSAMIEHPELKEVGLDQDAYEDLALPAYLITRIETSDWQNDKLVDADGKPVGIPDPPAAYRTKP